MNNHPQGEISLTFMSGPMDGKTLTFEQPKSGEQRVISIGRRDGCDVHLNYDNQVSRLHARLGCAVRPVSSADTVTVPTMLNFWLEDNGSRNGTYIEKEYEPINGRINLRPGTLFRIGRTWLRLDVPMSFNM